MKFPKITVKSLNGEDVSLPEAAHGKVTLIIIAFVRQPKGVVDSWLTPFKETFGTDDSYTFYEIPMLGGVFARTISSIIDAGMREGIPQAMHGHVVTYYGNADYYCAALGIRDKSICYTFLLDRNCKIKLRCAGSATSGEVDEMLRLARELNRQS